MAYEWAPAPPQINVPRYDFSGFAQAGSDIADIFVERRKQAATNSAIQQLMGATTDDQKRSAIARLATFNPQAAAAVSNMYAPLTQYQQAEIADAQARLAEEKRYHQEEMDVQHPFVGGEEPTTTTPPPSAPTPITPGASAQPTPAPASASAPAATTEDLGRPTAHRLTTDEMALDKDYLTKDFLPWTQAGQGETELGLRNLEHVQKMLLSSPEGTISGPLIGAAVKGSAKDPTDPKFIAARKYYGDKPWAASASHQRAVISSLKPLLGSRPSQQVIQSVIDSTYDPSVSQKENARRLGLLIENLKGKAKSASDKAKYYRQYHTLSGYKGATFDPDTIDSDILGGLEKGGGEDDKAKAARLQKFKDAPAGATAGGGKYTKQPSGEWWDKDGIPWTPE